MRLPPEEPAAGHDPATPPVVADPDPARGARARR